MLRKSITEEESLLFRHAVKGVSPLKPAKKPIKSAQKKYPAKRKNKIVKIKSNNDSIGEPPIFSEPIVLSAEENLFFAKSGLQHRLIQKMKKGQIQLEANIDLHRLTLKEAYIRVSHFIDACSKKHKRWICIIHGKGNYSKGGVPVLKSFLNQWLREHPKVLAFHSATAKNGGTGALYVLLKRE